MKAWTAILIVVLGTLSGRGRLLCAQTNQWSPAYLGFDRNEYPGDETLTDLRQTFSFTGYWLNVPPGATGNSWAGKREMLRAAGFGFLVLFNGRLDAELRKSRDPSGLGKADAATAVASAQREQFPAHTVIFLDVEEGGRMLPEQKAYIYAWVEGVNAGGFRAGVYCSGIPVSEGNGVTVITAEDLRETAGGRTVVYWVANDACPPSPGCVLPQRAPAPANSNVAFAQVWQFAQSPKRRDVARDCRASYAQDGNCYAPGHSNHKKLFVDLDSADSVDPSAGR